MGFEPGLAGWKVQRNPLSYGGTPRLCLCRVLSGLSIDPEAPGTNFDVTR